MTALVTLNEVKDYLGIPLSNTADDTQIQAILTGVLSTITQLVGDLSYWDKTIQILNTTVKDGVLWFKHKYVESIKSINGVDYTAKVNGTDYLLRYDGTAVVSGYEGIISNNFGAFDVVYVAGWKKQTTPTVINDVPADFVSIVGDMTALQFSMDFGRSITRETMWPRTVEYSDPARKGGGTWWSGKTPMGLIQARLRKYLPLHLRLW